MKNSKVLKDIYCTNKNCGEILCQSDGEFLYVGKLEIQPKTENGGKNKILIVCPKCNRRKKFFLKILIAKELAKNFRASKKFSIFRKRAV